MTKLSTLKKGDFFTLKPIDEPNEMQVYIKGDYDRASKTFCCAKFGDVNYERNFKGTKDVFVEFVF